MSNKYIYVPQYDTYGIIKSVKVELIFDEEAGKIVEMTPDEIDFALEEIYNESKKS